MLFISTISSPVQSFLVHFEITGAAGTVRTSKTKREENEEIREKQELESYDLLQDQDLSQDLDLQDLDPPNLQLALDLIHEIKEDLDQNLIPQMNSQDRTTRAKKPEKEKEFWNE